ncbi:hypothetical protein [Lactobacillus amylovorus]|uniref:hypothetical protein n=1 Tax=Lactobacillus amylovorus TaxID=1604 RepID=UPI00232D5860|nr:hypothetical protein [Lactobacillus amylovorus]MDB6229800.1 hypothetical protein [Lactobacillus amylovorus]
MDEVTEFNEQIEKLANNLMPEKAIAFTAGSYSDEKPDQVGWGLVILHKSEGKPISFSDIAKERNKEGEKKTGHRNILGEVCAVEKAFDWAAKNKITTLYLFSKSEDIYGWLRREFSANYEMTRKFKERGLVLQKKVHIPDISDLPIDTNYKVIRESKYGKMAKQLAKEAEK